MNIISFIIYIFSISIILPNLLACIPWRMISTDARETRSASLQFFIGFPPGLEHVSETDLDTEQTNDCNFTLIYPKKVINPYRSQIQNLVPMKPFGSFYQKCAACLAVATQIAKVVENSTRDNGTIYKHQDLINEDIAKNIAQLCTKGFKNFDLRKYENVSLITDNFHCTRHIQSNMDGNWTKKLREICNLYTAHMDLKHVSNNYANNTDEIVMNMCLGTGIFRDCLNVEETLPLETMQELSECTLNCTCEVKRMSHLNIIESNIE